MDGMVVVTKMFYTHKGIFNNEYFIGFEGDCDKDTWINRRRYVVKIFILD